MLPQVSNPLIGQCRTPPTWWLRCAESALFDVLLPFVFPNSSLPFFLSLSLHLIAFYLNLTPSTSPSLSLHFCCPPPILVSPSSPPTPSPRIQAVISRHSSTSRQLGPIRRGGALTPAFFHSRLLHRLKKLKPLDQFSYHIIAIIYKPCPPSNAFRAVLPLPSYGDGYTCWESVSGLPACCSRSRQGVVSCSVPTTSTFSRPDYPLSVFAFYRPLRRASQSRQ